MPPALTHGDGSHSWKVHMARSSRKTSRLTRAGGLWRRTEKSGASVAPASESEKVESHFGSHLNYTDDHCCGISRRKIAFFVEVLCVVVHVAQDVTWS